MADILERFNLTDDTTYSFPLLRGAAVRAEIEDDCATLLYDGLLQADYIEALLDRHGLDALKNYLRGRGFTEKLGLRVGDLGEVLSSSVICEFEGLVAPIDKLRYREHVDWPMKLTDVFSVRFTDGRVAAFCFTSVKSGVTVPPDNVATEGYAQLVKDANDEQPQIIGFVTAALYRESRFDELMPLDEALSAPAAVDKVYRLALVFDNGVWRERPLELLDEIEEYLADFRTYLLLIEDMRDLVQASYAIAASRCYPT